MLHAITNKITAHNDVGLVTLGLCLGEQGCALLSDAIRVHDVIRVLQATG